MSIDAPAATPKEPPEKPKRVSVRFYGCLTVLALLSLGGIFGGATLMGSWATLPAWGRAGSVLMVVLGSLLLLPVLGVIAAKIAMHFIFGHFKKSLADFGSLKDAMANQAKAMYEKIHEFRPATPDDFEGRDQAYYNAAQAELEAAGFRHLGDLIDETIEEIGMASPPIRVMTDGQTTAALFHVVPPTPGADDDEGDDGQDNAGSGQSAAAAPAKAGLKVCDLTTEFSNGVFLITTPTAGQDLMSAPPAIKRRQHPPGTPIATLLADHARGRQEMLSATPEAAAVTVNTLEEAIASEQRQQKVKNDFRKGIGYIDSGEIARIADKLSKEEAARHSAAAGDDAANPSNNGNPPAA